jgi:hypothetical protein
MRVSAEAGVGVLDDAPPAVLLHRPVALERHAGAVLNVELLQAPAVEGDLPNALVGHEFATFHTQLLQIGTRSRQQPQRMVGYVTFTWNANQTFSKR